MATKQFPAKIYVKWEEGNNRLDPPFLIADEGLSQMEDGDDVAIYGLLSVERLRETKELLKRRRR